MDFKSLNVFLAVCGNLSFTQTAEDLHMSVSAVSRSIQRLEDEFGNVLFDRDRRGMRATHAAKRLQPVAERMLADWRGIQHSLGEGGSVSGELRIFCSVTATHRLLSPLLSAYRDAYPGVHVLLQTGDQADGIDRVRRAASDAAVVARPPELPRPLVFRSLASTPLCLCAPAADVTTGQLLAHGDSSKLWAHLQTRPWILAERGVSKEFTDEFLRERYESIPHVYARVAGHEAIVAMVALGLGVALVPRLVIESSGVEDALLTLPLEDSVQPLDVGLCIRRGRLSDPVMAGLWNVAEDLGPALVNSTH